MSLWINYFATFVFGFIVGAVIASLTIVVKADTEADFKDAERNLHIKHIERMDKGAK